MIGCPPRYCLSAALPGHSSTLDVLQLMGWLLPAGAQKPGSTSVQADALVWYSPGSQFAQLAAPADATLPASQGWGTDVPSPHAQPAEHILQSLIDVAFAVPFHVPNGQSRASGLPTCREHEARYEACSALL